MLQYDESSSLTNRYLHGPAVDQVLADEDALDNVLWPLPDGQGTVRDLVNDSGVVQNHITYDAFGNITSVAADHLYAYTGREWDPDAELYYYRARWYDPAVGRFLSEDPLSFNGGDFNLSAYVGNSPTNFVDPSGQQGRPWKGYWGEVGEIFKGYGDSIVGTVSGVVEVALDPVGAAQGLASSVWNYDETAKAIVDGVSESLKTNRGIGRLVGDGLSTVAGGGVAKAVAKSGALAKLANAAGKTRVGKAVAAAHKAGLGKAADAARRATKLANGAADFFGDLSPQWGVRQWELAQRRLAKQAKTQGGRDTALSGRAAEEAVYLTRVKAEHHESLGS